MLSFFYEISQQGKIRLNRNPTAALKAWFPQAPVTIPTYWNRKLTKAGAILGWFFFPSTPQKFAKIIDASYEKYYAMADPNFDWTKEPKELTSYFTQGKLYHSRLNYRYFASLVTDMAARTYYSIHGMYLRHLAVRRGSRLLVAIKQHQIENGAWPANLDAVKSLAPAEIFVDPLNNNSFIYKLTDDGFTLYSKGKNGIDDEGRRERDLGNPCEPKVVDKGADDWIIWPPRSRKIPKESTHAD
jgi:hypothetical protein